MKFLISVIDNETGTATEAEMSAIGEFNERLQHGDNLRMAEGLAAPSSSVVIDGRGETPELVDGPFRDTEDYVSGFWIIEAPDGDVARRIASEASQACNRRVELRGIL